MTDTDKLFELPRAKDANVERELIKMENVLSATGLINFIAARDLSDKAALLEAVTFTSDLNEAAAVSIGRGTWEEVSSVSLPTLSGNPDARKLVLASLIRPDALHVEVDAARRNPNFQSLTYTETIIDGISLKTITEEGQRVSYALTSSTEIPKS